MTIGSVIQVGPHQVQCRPRLDSDHEFLLSVYRSTREEEMAQVDWLPEQKEAFLRMQYTAQDRSYVDHYPGAAFLVILVDDQPAGRLFLHRREREIRIMEIALLPEWRRRGIGTALLEGVLGEARSKNWTASIHVEIFNPAKRCYARLGFKPVSVHGVYCLMEWTPSSVPQPD
jgi:GNAT superfamily N-acetyltransferase